MNVTGYEHHVLDLVVADGFQDAQALLGEAFPGVVVLAFAVGVEHDAGHHEFDARRAVDQPLEQGVFLFRVEDATIVG
ncbi:hypothetical protein D3C76_1569650 [compost metagenome]